MTKLISGKLLTLLLLSSLFLFQACTTDGGCSTAATRKAEPLPSPPCWRWRNAASGMEFLLKFMGLSDFIKK